MTVVRQRRARVAFWAAMLALLPCPASSPDALASRVRTMNIEQLAQRAARIFSGRCLDVRVHEDASLRHTVTDVTVAVTRTVKGNVHGRIVFRLLGDQTASAEKGRGVDGVPTFRRGEELVLFLYGDSASGLTSPVGFGQGKFGVIRDKAGRKLAVNGSGNQNLLRGVTAPAERKVGPDLARWKEKREIDPEVLLDIAAELGE